MIAFLTGTVQGMTVKSIVLLTGGVGYRVYLPLTDLSRVGTIGDRVSLHIHTHVREDMLDLFGFLEESKLQLFELLIGVSGIGPKMALAVLSGLSPADLQKSIAHNDHQVLTRIPGVGTKTAQRIVIELKDRLGKVEWGTSQITNFQSQILADVRSAISHLGYKPQLIEKAIKAIEPLAHEGKPLESILKEALRQLN